MPNITVKPGVVGYLKTDSIATAGSPYGENQGPAAGTVVADQSKFFSSTPATDDTPGGVAAFMFLQVNTDATVLSKVLDRNYIITNVSAYKTGGNGDANDKAKLSKVSADGVTTTSIGDLSLNVNEKVFATAGSATFFPVTLAAGETLKVTAAKTAGNCAATVYVHVIGA